MTVPAIGDYRTNANVIVACAQLGHLHRDWWTVDPTYGLGRFWTLWRPDRLDCHDLNPAKSPTTGRAIDFRDLPYDNGQVDAVVFDPPYKLNGRSDLAMDAGYGVDIRASWQDRMQLCRDGITEAVRVTRPGGRVLVKCQDQVCSGQVRWQTIDFANHAMSLGCRLVDRFDLLSYRPQPEGRRQVHARRNHSTLLVFATRTVTT